MNKKNIYVIFAAIAFVMAFLTKIIEVINGSDLSLERYVLAGIVFPLLVLAHFIYHLRNPNFYDDEKEYKMISVIYKYVCIPACFLYIFAGILFG